jgi:hypothetical protein
VSTAIFYIYLNIISNKTYPPYVLELGKYYCGGKNTDFDLKL